ncbi:MAG TPA: response regulator [Candidatus Lokiarchaeia archaeon]|nr:response regulator [Candidatus Lokiarchaeia archaeon]
MLVDDEPGTCQLVETILKMQGYEVTVTHDGEQALSLLENEISLPDLIILDVMLPKLSGYDVAERIKADERLQTIPVVLFSAKSKRDIEQKVKEIGLAGFISKPFAIKDFERVISANLNT